MDDSEGVVPETRVPVTMLEALWLDNCRSTYREDTFVHHFPCGFRLGREALIFPDCFSNPGASDAIRAGHHEHHDVCIGSGFPYGAPWGLVVTAPGDSVRVRCCHDGHHGRGDGVCLRHTHRCLE